MNLTKPLKSTLLKVISSPESLRDAWDALNKSNKNSRGLSRETIEEFKNSLDTQILEVSKLLAANKYKFNQVRAVLIPKKTEGEFRPLRIADIRDRLVQKALSMILDKLLSSKYQLNNGCSFAYQDDLGVKHAVQKMVEHYKNGFKIILEADIKKFFDTVNRKNLLAKVFTDLPDSSINNLIEESLAQSVGNLADLSHDFHHYFTESINGIPQGNSLSPLLANIYLSDFDQRMIKEGLCLVRYADDFIVLCKTTKDARKAYEIAKDELEIKLGLELHPLPTPQREAPTQTRKHQPWP
ncbi:MAG: hypothetical protein EOO85_26950 [Pedobacter sp.]|nr:MAG: hypothetical protein EOO85_26950 [Pedobacter sp.]